jgi:hypothetical protein
MTPLLIFFLALVFFVGVWKLTDLVLSQFAKRK